MIRQDEFIRQPANRDDQNCYLTLFKGSLIVVSKTKKSKKITKVLNLDLAKCTYIQSGKLSGFLFSKGNETFPIYSKCKKQFKIWKNLLRPKVILDNIHQEYKYIDTVGQGTFSTVYEVKNKFRKKFAIKTFNKYKLNKKDVAALVNEIQIMRRLGSHDSVIRLYEVHETHDSIYLILELLKTQNLFEYLISQFPFKEKTLVRLMKSTL